MPALEKTNVCVGAPAPSLRAHLYVTVPAEFAVMLAVNSNFFGHAPVKLVGETAAVTPVVEKETGDGVGVGVGVGVGEGVGVRVGFGVGLGVALGVALGVGLGVGEGEGVGVGSGVTIGDGVGLGACSSDFEKKPEK